MASQGQDLTDREHMQAVRLLSLWGAASSFVCVVLRKPKAEAGYECQSEAFWIWHLTAD